MKSKGLKEKTLIHDNMSYIDNFNKIFHEKVKSFKLNKYFMEREYINSYKFKTKNSNDIKFSLLQKAEDSVDRNMAKSLILTYVKDLYIAEQIEHGLFEFALIYVVINGLNDHFVENVYIDKLYDICSNLDIKNKHIDNQTLLPNIFDNKFNPYFVAFMSPDQIHPKRWAEIIGKLQRREESANNFQTTDMYRCAKCGARKFKITEMQLRCSDEPASRFHTCMVCYHTFIK